MLGELAGAVELQAIGEQEQADLRAGDGVVAVGDGVDDGFVDDAEIVGGNSSFARPSFSQGRPHESGDERDSGVDLIGDRAGKPLRVDEIVGGEASTSVARGFDGPRRQELGRLRREDEQASHRRAVQAVLIPEGHSGVAQKVEPGNRRQSPEERLESIAVKVPHGGGMHRLFVEHVLAAPLLEKPGKLRRREVPLGGPDPYVVTTTRCSVHIQSAWHLRQQNTVIAFFVVRQECLADDRANRRIAVVGRDIEKPVLDRIPFLRGNPARRARVIDTEEHNAPFGVRKRNQLAGKLLRVGGQHASVPETNLLEL